MARNEVVGFVLRDALKLLLPPERQIDYARMAASIDRVIQLADGDLIE